MEGLLYVLNAKFLFLLRSQTARYFTFTVNCKFNGVDTSLSFILTGQSKREYSHSLLFLRSRSSFCALTVCVGCPTYSEQL